MSGVTLVQDSEKENIYTKGDGIRFKICSVIWFWKSGSEWVGKGIVNWFVNCVVNWFWNGVGKWFGKFIGNFFGTCRGNLVDWKWEYWWYTDVETGWEIEFKMKFGMVVVLVFLGDLHVLFPPCTTPENCVSKYKTSLP